jgi:hypothetical protein
MLLRTLIATSLSFDDHSHALSVPLTHIQQGAEEQRQIKNSFFIRILGNDVYMVAKMKLETLLDVGDDQNDVGDLGGWYNLHRGGKASLRCKPAVLDVPALSHGLASD